MFNQNEAPPGFIALPAHKFTDTGQPSCSGCHFHEVQAEDFHEICGREECRADNRTDGCDAIYVVRQEENKVMG